MRSGRLYPLRMPDYRPPMNPRHVPFVALDIGFTSLWGVILCGYMFFKAKNTLESIIVHVGAGAGAAAILGQLYAVPIWAILHFA